MPSENSFPEGAVNRVEVAVSVVVVILLDVTIMAAFVIVCYFPGLSVDLLLCINIEDIRLPNTA